MRLVTAARSGAKWWLHHEIAPIFNWIVDECERRGYLFDHGPTDVDDDWGYANRPIRGSNQPSDHSWGLAGDIDAQNFPMGQSRRQPPAWIIALFEHYRFTYGGRWSRPDPMHFEFNGTPAEARFIVACLAAAHVASKPVPMPPNAEPPVDWPAVRRLGAGSLVALMSNTPNLNADSPAGPSVQILQKTLNVVMDAKLAEHGRYDAPTAQAVANLQAYMNGIRPGAIRDPNGAAMEGTRWLLVVSLQNIRDGKA